MLEQQIKEALRKAGLNENLFTLITVQTEAEIEGAVSNLKSVISPIIQQEGDRRATQATQTAVSNYEKKYSLKDGKLVQQTEGGQQNQTTPPANNTTGLPPEIVAILENQNKQIATLQTLVEGQQKTIKLKERGDLIRAKLTEAGIPEKLHRRFSVSEDADEESLTTAITEFKQELTDLGLQGLGQPGKGTGITVFESTAEQAADARNNNQGAGNTGGVPAKKL